MRFTLRDPELPHQIVISAVGHELSVSCNCLAGVDGQKNHHSPIEVRSLWTWPEAKRVYEEYHARECGVVPIGIGRMAH